MFGSMMRFDMSDGSFPVYTTKRVYWKTAVKEMLWFLSGQTNIRTLLQENVRIWSDWPLAKYRKATGTSLSQEEFETKILLDEDFANEWGIWDRYTESNGVVGEQRTGQSMTSLLRLLSCLEKIQRVVECCFMHGTCLN